MAAMKADDTGRMTTAKECTWPWPVRTPPPVTGATVVVVVTEVNCVADVGVNQVDALLLGCSGTGFTGHRRWWRR